MGSAFLLAWINWLGVNPGFVDEDKVALLNIFLFLNAFFTFEYLSPKAPLFLLIEFIKSSDPFLKISLKTNKSVLSDLEYFLNLSLKKISSFCIPFPANSPFAFWPKIK